MAQGEQYWIERAQSAEAKLSTCQSAQDGLKEEVRTTRETFGARKRSDGSYEINYDIFVEHLGLEAALQVRAIIDEKYHVSGAAGEKPRVRMPSKAAS